MQEIAVKLGYSPHKVVYWMDMYGMKRRSISDAVYLKNNPNGDPFVIREPQTAEEFALFGLGLGLFWGEGNKASKNSVRLANTDPDLLKAFMRFLITLCGVRRDDLHFNLQIFSDIDPDDALNYWTATLDVRPSQFYRPTLSPSVSVGTYRLKAPYGVLSVYYNNRNLRHWFATQLPR